MCPAFEVIEREYQNQISKFERDPVTGLVDPARAVKVFKRPAAGDEMQLPSDVRPPLVLKKTLDYLFHELLPQYPFEETHNLISDRTRGVRQDFTVQHERGDIAIECHERIVRYHILAFHQMKSVPNFRFQLELEQLHKSLTSLMEFYDDAHRTGIFPLNEPEFRAYHLLAHLRNGRISTSLERQSDAIIDAPIVQLAMELHAAGQRNNAVSGKHSPNCPAAQNTFARFFGLVARPSTPYLIACLLEHHFESVRTGAFKSMKAGVGQNQGLSIQKMTDILGFNNDDETTSYVKALNIPIVELRGRPHIGLSKNVDVIGKSS
ncbi:hypothetical protein DL93DRAFT_2049034 [Clavulina sp. PMI_390]|nr:hypothetical protein DL93DRAFT_2049034 [Clavulina sp. PMI_390]